MRLKAIVDERFADYKKVSMFLGSATCGGKCCIEAGIPITVCQNDPWRSKNATDVANINIVTRYKNNPITSAIVIGGLEPFEQYNELWEFIVTARYLGVQDDIVIYTGYYKEEIADRVEELSSIPNIVIKYGRYIPNRPSRYDPVLGVTLISDNQYAERIS